MTTLIYTHFIMSKMSLRERLIFELLFREMVLLVLRLHFFFFPPPSCFRTVFVPTSFANVLSFFRPLTTSPISGAAISNKSDPFCSWDYIFFNEWNCSSPKSLCKSTKYSSTLPCMSTKNRKIS